MKNNTWQQPLRYAFVFSLLGAVVWFIFVAWPLINALIVSALIAYVLQPAVQALAGRLPIKRVWAVNVVYLIFLSVLALIPVLLTPVVLRQIQGISIDFYAISDEITALLDTEVKVGNLTIPLDNFIADVETMFAQTVASLGGNALGTLPTLTTNLLWILLILFTVYYLLRDGQRLIDWCVTLVPTSYHYHAHRIIDEVNQVWSSFLRGQLVLMVIIGVFSGVAAWAVGLPGAVIIGIVAGVFDLIPSLGPTIATLIAMAVAFIEGSTLLPVSNWVFALIVGGVFILIQQAEAVWFRPAVMGRRLRLHPALIFIGVFGALAISGILVALVIIPVMSTIGILWRYTTTRLKGLDPYPKTPLTPAPPTEPEPIAEQGRGGQSSLPLEGREAVSSPES